MLPGPVQSLAPPPPHFLGSKDKVILLDVRLRCRATRSAYF